MNNILNKEIQIDKKKFCKMIFLFNSLEDGWTIKKNKDEYILTKAHENKKEIFNDEYISHFVSKNINCKEFFN